MNNKKVNMNTIPLTPNYTPKHSFINNERNKTFSKTPFLDVKKEEMIKMNNTNIP